MAGFLFGGFSQDESPLRMEKLRLQATENRDRTRLHWILMNFGGFNIFNPHFYPFLIYSVGWLYWMLLMLSDAFWLRDCTQWSGWILPERWEFGDRLFLPGAMYHIWKQGTHGYTQSWWSLSFPHSKWCFFGYPVSLFLGPTDMYDAMMSFASSCFAFTLKRSRESRARSSNKNENLKICSYMAANQSSSLRVNDNLFDPDKYTEL